MNHRIHSRILSTLVAAAAAASLAAGPAFAQDEAGSASEQWTQSIEQIKEYGADQREEAVEASQSAADAIDSRLQKMENWVAENWNELSAKAREDRRAIINDLRQQRNDLAEWFGAMKHSSAESWEEVKAGFVNAYHTIGEKADSAMDQFKSDGGSQ